MKIKRGSLNTPEYWNKTYKVPNKKAPDFSQGDELLAHYKLSTKNGSQKAYEGLLTYNY